MTADYAPTLKATAHDITDPFWDPEPVDRAAGGPAALSPFDGPGFGQVPQDLPDEKRVPFRFLVDRPGQGKAGLVEGRAGGLLDEGRDADVVETAQ